MDEIRLAGAIEGAMREAGGEYPAMPTWLSTGLRPRGSYRTPTRRRIAPSEPLETEFAGVHRRYHAVTMQTLWLAKPDRASRHAYNAALQSLRAGSGAV